MTVAVAAPPDPRRPLRYFVLLDALQRIEAMDRKGHQSQELSDAGYIARMALRRAGEPDVDVTA